MLADKHVKSVNPSCYCHTKAAGLIIALKKDKFLVIT